MLTKRSKKEHLHPRRCLLYTSCMVKVHFSFWKRSFLTTSKPSLLFICVCMSYMQIAWVRTEEKNGSYIKTNPSKLFRSYLWKCSYVNVPRGTITPGRWGHCQARVKTASLKLIEGFSICILLTLWKEVLSWKWLERKFSFF